MIQPGLFEADADEIKLREALIHALGDFQARKKLLGGRELAFDRLRGAFRRAFGKFGIDEPTDERIASVLESIGVEVKRVPSFVAKHPFRLMVPEHLATKSLESFLKSG